MPSAASKTADVPRGATENGDFSPAENERAHA
jgi:hypothetical protein